jgi:hypothetical protein
VDDKKSRSRRDKDGICQTAARQVQVRFTFAGLSSIYFDHIVTQGVKDKVYICAAPRTGQPTAWDGSVSALTVSRALQVLIKEFSTTFDTF